ncbi:uncharacterized protein BDZ99DRAFT_470751 [Mytilinidion resinicola]|uniref:Uncharacterized protein n=1 Tax=Mytilinidion resinicola TaxID=574789 RepID=A0A6A6Z9V6_9PEZI|nr:uncharacterized protein BDZ99DRAFT_470751 [Mytilinidion resinicola]KAF2817796.1 hypothetical protein BDZ99DRAFT_470751 [Mytilinidion resinicola]
MREWKGQKHETGAAVEYCSSNTTVRNEGWRCARSAKEGGREKERGQAPGLQGIARCLKRRYKKKRADERRGGVSQAQGIMAIVMAQSQERRWGGVGRRGRGYHDLMGGRSTEASCIRALRVSDPTVAGVSVPVWGWPLRSSCGAETRGRGSLMS